jgi:hypothetical protein
MYWDLKFDALEYAGISFQPKDLVQRPLKPARKNRRCWPEYQQQQPNNKIFLFFFFTCWMDQKKIRKWGGGKLLDATDALYAPFDVIHHRKGFYCRCWPSFSFFWAPGATPILHVFLFSPQCDRVLLLLLYYKNNFFFYPFLFVVLFVRNGRHGVQHAGHKEEYLKYNGRRCPPTEFPFLTLTIAWQRDKVYRVLCTRVKSKRKNK